MKPRLRSLLWSFMALTLLLAGTTLVCAYDISFSDVPESSWFYEDVMTLNPASSAAIPTVHIAPPKRSRPASRSR